MTVQGALQQWLGDLIQVEAIDVQSEDSTLRVRVTYTVRRSQTTASRRVPARRTLTMIYFCCDDRRRIEVRDHSGLNGIDFLEVLDLAATNQADRQRTLFVHLLKPIAGALSPDNVVIEGGARIRNVTVMEATVGTGDQNNILTVKVDRAGDYSTYTLRLVAGQRNPNPPTGFDRYCLR